MAVTVPAEEFGIYDFGLSTEDEARAQQLHRESIVIDMLFQGPCGYRTYASLEGKAPTGELWADYLASNQLPVRRALTGGCDDFYDCWAGSGITAANRQVVMDDVGLFASAQAQFDAFPWLVKALKADDIRLAKREGRLAGYVSMQDTEGVDRKLNQLQTAYDFGARMIGLTYNMQNTVGGGCTEKTDSGVSNFGAAVIARMDELGIIVDTAHSGRQTTLDACQLSERPVVASHTSAAALYEVDRGKSDEELRALAETGGVIGIVAIPAFLGPGPVVTIEAMLDHIDYVSELVGWRHVGIGTDWPLQAARVTLEAVYMPLMMEMGFRPEHNLSIANLVGFDDYRDCPNITRGLVSRGYDDEQIRAILGENFLRVFEEVCG
jgi:membrane dipeptidase